MLPLDTIVLKFRLATEGGFNDSQEVVTRLLAFLWEVRSCVTSLGSPAEPGVDYPLLTVCLPLRTLCSPDYYRSFK